MKFSCLFAAALAFFLAGCGDNSSSTTPAATNNPATNSSVLSAPVDYLGAVMQAKKYAEKTIDVSYVNHAIQEFYASEGRYPKDLKEMVPTYLGKIPEAPYGSKLVYDPASGTVKVVKQ